MKIMKMDNLDQGLTSTPRIARGVPYIQAKNHPDKRTPPQITKNIAATEHLENVDDQDADIILRDIRTFVLMNVWLGNVRKFSIIGPRAWLNPGLEGGRTPM